MAIQTCALKHKADFPRGILVRHDRRFGIVPSGCVSVMMRPVLKRLSSRKLEQVPLAVPACDKGPEDGPELVNVLSMFRHLRSTIRMDLHSQCAHHRLQSRTPR